METQAVAGLCVGCALFGAGFGAFLAALVLSRPFDRVGGILEKHLAELRAKYDAADWWKDA